MKIVNTTSVFMPGADLFESVDRLKAAGFDSVDIAFDYCLGDGHPFTSDHWKEWAEKLRRHADGKGVDFYQGHGIGNPETIYAGGDILAYRVLDAAAILGIKWIVMHPQKLAGMEEPESDGLYAEKNALWFRPFAEYAAGLGVGVALENLPWPNCNRIQPLIKLADAIGTGNVGICWDTGHANINLTKPSEIKAFGKRLVTLHLHDNHPEAGDEHLIPFQGTYDWDEFAKTLREMDYCGELVLEAHHQMLDADGNAALQERLLAEMKTAAERIREMILKP